MISLVEVLSPILIDGEWHKIGATTEVDHADAIELEKNGMVDIISTDGVTATWGSCCSQH